MLDLYSAIAPKLFYDDTFFKKMDCMERGIEITIPTIFYVINIIKKK